MNFKIKLLTSALSIFCLVGSSLAYVDSGGTEFSLTRTENGVLLKSKHVSIYLDRTCAASSAHYGKGVWGWANGGVLITFEKRRIGFPRQDSPLDDGGKCRL